MVTPPSRQEKYSRVPGRWGVPAITAPGRKSILTSISSGTGSGTSGFSVTPRPWDWLGSSDAVQRRTFARAGARSSSIGTPSFAATFTRTASEGLPSPDSRLAMVERGRPAALASASCVRWRECLRLVRLRARFAATRSGLSIGVTFRQRNGQRLEDSWGDSILEWTGEIPMDTHIAGTKHSLRVAITGGTSGLGLALARGFAALGARIAVIARGRDGLDRAAREIPGVIGIVGDVSKKEDIYPIATQVLGNLGGLDILVNNASSLGPMPLALLAIRSARTSRRR